MEEKRSKDNNLFTFSLLENNFFLPYPEFLACSELEFLKSLWGQGTEQEQGFRTVPPGYKGWRNSFLGINAGAP
jgi:hypothetical protein